MLAIIAIAISLLGYFDNRRTISDERRDRKAALELESQPLVTAADEPGLPLLKRNADGSGTLVIAIQNVGLAPALSGRIYLRLPISGYGRSPVIRANLPSDLSVPPEEVQSFASFSALSPGSRTHVRLRLTREATRAIKANPGPFYQVSVAVFVAIYADVLGNRCQTAWEFVTLRPGAPTVSGGSNFTPDRKRGCTSTR